jgi:hypothetical protein
MISPSLPWSSHLVSTPAESYEGVGYTFVQLASLRAHDVIANVQ